MRRIVHFGGVSMVAFVLAQCGLAIAYGAFGWAVLPAVLFSLVVSAVPAYLLSRRYVWPDRGAENARVGEGGMFLLIGLIGSLITALVVTIVEHIARNHTTDHVLLTLSVNGASIASTVVIWLARFVVLDRTIFRRQGRSGAADERRIAEVTL